MTREEVQAALRWPKTLEEVENAQKALDAYLKEHPDDYDLLQEAESLALLEEALQHKAAQIQQPDFVGTIR
jgi:hypothetical protein